MSVKTKRSLDWIENSIDKEFHVKGGESSKVDVAHILDDLSRLTGLYLGPGDLSRIGDDSVNQAGRFPRRLSSHVYKNYGVRLDSSTIERIGNLASAHTISGAQYTVTLDRKLWRAGEFGDRDSCFFMSRKAAPKVIFRSGGAAVKLYNLNGTPYARAWIVPHYGTGVIFNPYTVGGMRTLSPLGVARVLTATDAPFFGHKITGASDVMNYGQSNGTLWINNAEAAVIFGRTHPGELEGRIDFRIKVGPVCSHCGDLAETPELQWRGGTYCEACYPVRPCAQCGVPNEQNNMYVLDNTRYCAGCFAALSRNCRCGRTHHRNRMTYDGMGVWRCAHCVSLEEERRRSAVSFVFDRNMTSSSTTVNFSTIQESFRDRQRARAAQERAMQEAEGRRRATELLDQIIDQAVRTGDAPRVPIINAPRIVPIYTTTGIADEIPPDDTPPQLPPIDGPPPETLVRGIRNFRGEIQGQWIPHQYQTTLTPEAVNYLRDNERARRIGQIYFGDDGARPAGRRTE